MIDSYSFGSMTIGGVKYSADLKIVEGRIEPNWWRKDGHSLCETDITDIILAKPDVLIIGTGAYGVLKVPNDVAALLESHGIELIAVPTGEAVVRYNALESEKNVAAGFHLTC
ncbi:MAG: hypothetical protein JW941_06435 [Candidatus Coatesbacteria bacterium]|nr:hypothetical protein [Candidatus Coatesbacteria bacterium]